LDVRRTDDNVMPAAGSLSRRFRWKPGIFTVSLMFPYIVLIIIL